MGKNEILARVEAFKTSLAELRKTNILKYDDIKQITGKYIEKIESYDGNYVEGMEVYKKFDEYLTFCEALIPYYENLSSGYFRHSRWIK